MKSTNDQIKITVKTIENEQLPDWVKQHTVWVETKLNDGNSKIEESARRMKV